MPLEELVVVDDDPVVDPDDGAVADGVVVRGDRRVALGVVADVDEGLDGVGGNGDLVEELTRPGTLRPGRWPSSCWNDRA